ncbi:hypothetical protein [Aliagarivorans marinus]|uniref:hypothetical protein n=1 Tax=Aliagarivorans marinus TaxID=561965 RepID=UPI000478EDCE|nr:hypothetical protein [Aliagarivorans marinus]
MASAIATAVASGPPKRLLDASASLQVKHQGACIDIRASRSRAILSFENRRLLLRFILIGLGLLKRYSGASHLAASNLAVSTAYLSVGGRIVAVVSTKALKRSMPFKGLRVRPANLRAWLF